MNELHKVLEKQKEKVQERGLGSSTESNIHYYLQLQQIKAKKITFETSVTFPNNGNLEQP